MKSQEPMEDRATENPPMWWVPKMDWLYTSPISPSIDGGWRERLLRFVFALMVAGIAYVVGRFLAGGSL